MIKPKLILRAEATTQVEFKAKVFADSFPEPINLKAQLELMVKPKPCALADVIPDLDEVRKTASRNSEFWISNAAPYVA